jgi:hypothetical protein
MLPMRSMADISTMLEDWSTCILRKRYWGDMKTIILLLFIYLVLESTANAESYRAIADEIEISNGQQVRTCKLDRTPQYAVTSFDDSALIVSQRGYVAIKDIEVCDPMIPVHVSLIPDRVGVLSDINISKNIYASLDFVSVQPFLYLAIVAHIGSSRNLVTLNGAYVDGRSLPELQRHAFGGSGDAGTAIISPDGKFVAPSGQVDCDADAAPGVWDIEKSRRVITAKESCSALFSSKGNK